MPGPRSLERAEASLDHLLVIAPERGVEEPLLAPELSVQAEAIDAAVPDPDEMASVHEYLKGVLPVLTGAGGTQIKRLKVDRVIRGEPSGMVLVMDFDSADAITAMFDSDDYAALIPMRDRRLCGNEHLAHLPDVRTLARRPYRPTGSTHPGWTIS